MERKFKIGDFVRYSLEDEVNNNHLMVWKIIGIDEEEQEYVIENAVRHKWYAKIAFEDEDNYHVVQKVRARKIPDDITLREICKNFVELVDYCDVDRRVIDVLIRRVKNGWKYNYWFSD